MPEIVFTMKKLKSLNAKEAKNVFYLPWFYRFCDQMIKKNGYAPIRAILFSVF